MRHGLYLLAFALACALPGDSWAVNSSGRTTAASLSAPPAETAVAEVASRREAKRQRRASRAARRADPGERRELNGLAIAGFVISIAGFPLLGFVASILGLVFGLVALSKIRKYGQRGKGFAIAAIVLGGLGILTFGVLIAAIIVVGGR